LASTRYFQWGSRGLVVACGYEILEDLVADVGSSLVEKLLLFANLYTAIYGDFY
jgi:hypothetical protein